MPESHGFNPWEWLKDNILCCLLLTLFCYFRERATIFLGEKPSGYKFGMKRKSPILEGFSKSLSPKVTKEGLINHFALAVVPALKTAS